MNPLIENFRDYDVVILANGSFPTAEAALRLLCQAPFVCACDGAVEAFPEADAVVGDGDSLSDIFLSRLVRVTEQEDNDLTKATRHCLSLGMHHTAYLGATGLGEPHTTHLSPLAPFRPKRGGATPGYRLWLAGSGQGQRLV